MTPLRPAPPASVAEALSDLATIGPFFAITVGDADGAWRPIAHAYAEGMPHLVAARAARYRTSELRVAASIVQLGHAARLWSLTLGCAVAHGLVPDLDDLHQETEGAALLVPRPRGWLVPDALPQPRGWLIPDPLPRPGGWPDSETLAPVLYRLVMEEHLAALAAGLRVKVASGLLHGNAASALAEAARELIKARPSLRAPVTELTRRLLGTGDLRGRGLPLNRDFAFRRSTCCLYYRVPGGSGCGDCSLDRDRHRPPDG
ncbi:(2Fe-2S)-binding protein [Nonomuraea sp. NPDC050404]|uniref:(2Fe-2S)-binding protein n=1 Tax=Nonomuraea sp. NPDC050404 TaxID=3155783 RepID=UPI0033C58302